VISGFAPIAREDARVLVLGTVPSARSLACGRYYAHPHNRFWPIMEALFADGEALGHPAREAMVLGARVAVWDVLASADRRQGSMDASIVSATAVPNDIAGFVDAHPDLRAIFFNGATAASLFDRHAAPTMDARRPLELLRLPSTSPANAALSAAEKLAAWRVVADAAREA